MIKLPVLTKKTNLLNILLAVLILMGSFQTQVHSAPRKSLTNQRTPAAQEERTFWSDLIFVINDIKEKIMTPKEEKPPPPKTFEWHPLQSFIAHVKEKNAQGKNPPANRNQPAAKSLAPEEKSDLKSTNDISSNNNINSNCTTKLKEVDRQFRSENQQQKLITDVLKSLHFVECLVPINPFKDQWKQANAKTINAYFATSVFSDKGSEMKKQYQLMITSAKIVYDRLLQISDEFEYQQARARLNASLTNLEKYASQLPSQSDSSNSANAKLQRCEFTNKMANRVIKGTRNAGEVLSYFTDSGLYMDYESEYLDLPDHQLVICTSESWQNCNTDTVLKCQKKFNYECDENSICEEVN